MKTSTQETKSIEDIVKLIDKEKLVLPEFQRDFKWPLEKTETLFDSILKDLFIGSLIVSKPDFDLACRGFDLRERGKRERKPKTVQYTKDQFEQEDIYTLLDGQQRVTSIYRAIKGMDKVYVTFKDSELLRDSEIWDDTIQKIKKGIDISFDKYIDGVTSVKPLGKTYYICLGDLYENIDEMQDDFQEAVIDPILENDKIDFTHDDKKIYKIFGIKFWNDFKTDVYKKTNLISVQLLNMDLEKFCLYFERSNSQGLNLSFTDIITAKIYLTFNLRNALKKLEKEPYFQENLVDPLVRYINFKVNGDVTKKSILKDLDGEAFKKNWDSTVKDIIHVQKWLEDNHWVFKVENIPYKTMLLPLLSFFQNLPNKDFSQASAQQIDIVRFWFYASIYDNRYGGARHGSTNVVLKKDCEVLRDLAIGIAIPTEYWSNFKIEFSFEEFLNIDSNTNTKFLTVNYLMWSKEKFKNLENNANISISEKIDVHHIYPVKYIDNNFAVDSFEDERVDCVLNKIRINKISNIKIRDKAPSIYLKELLANNIEKDTNGVHLPQSEINAKNNLIKSLETHCIPFSEDLLNGSNDNKFEDFLKARYQLFEKYLKLLDDAHLNIKTAQSTIWQ
ncbi:DUF262 domain-containing protein [Acinetobacter sp. YH12145]|uniref:DUF262 domain-containing protein n=1 Tax=Acinetobacter TaxID=469 RepID=UPI0015D2F398|nr:DUF262 domain-containing protein [Acinetobacter sp. YH12145]